MSTRNWRTRPGRAALQKIIASKRFDDANLGVLTGLSGITVIDVDAAEDIARAIDLFGPTPLRVRTPRRGVHLYYRSTGEPSSNLRPKGLEVDVKGLGGLVIVPPSYRRMPPSEGTPYVFESGDWTTVARLPTIRADALKSLKKKEAGPHPQAGSGRVPGDGVGAVGKSPAVATVESLA